MATVDPRVTLPYWNWGFGEDEETTELFVPERMGPRGGSLGAGYFAEAATPQNSLGFPIHPDVGPFGTGLSRTGVAGPASLPNEPAVLAALEMAAFSQFRPALEGGTDLPAGHNGMHNGVHGWVGGDMGAMTSPNDPIFFMHHAQVDRIWSIWQRKHAGVANYNDSNQFVGQGHGPDDHMWPWDAGASSPGASGSPGRNPAVAIGLVPTEAPIDLVRPADVLDTRALGYLYDGEDAPREFARSGVSVTDQWSTITLSSGYDRPAAVAGMQTFNGSDTATVRLRSMQAQQFDIRVQEEQSRDAEVRHNPESIGYLVGEPGLIYDSSGRAVGEFTRMRLGQPSRNHWERVQYRRNYVSPVIIGQVASSSGSDPAHVRLRAVDHDAFDLQIEEWSYLDGRHTVEDICLVVVEAGSHRLQDGTLVDAGTTTVNHDWTTVSFASAFDMPPLVLTQCLSRSGRDPVTTRVRQVTASTFEVRLQEEEAKEAGGHNDESVAYLALHRR